MVTQTYNVAAELAISCRDNLDKVLVHGGPLAERHFRVAVEWIHEARVLIPKRQALDVMRHIKRLSAKRLEVVDMHIVLLKTLSGSKVKVASNLVFEDSW
jgi:hypothetical protein